MFKQPQSSKFVERLNDEGVDEPLDIRAILKSCKFLPAVVADSDLTSVVERVVDQRLLGALTNESACPGGSDWNGRSKRREEALSRYLGSVLICVFIRLPGVHYTIEIDPEIRGVVHCEWQQI